MARVLRIGICRERMKCEGRIPIFPSGHYGIAEVRNTLPELELEFLVESGLGHSIGLNDAMWEVAGATVVEDFRRIFWGSDIILGVKEPREDVVAYYREGQGSLCFQHIAGNRPVAASLLAKRVVLMPFEYHRPTLEAMSRLVGPRIPVILERCYGLGWRHLNIFVGGAQGAVGQNTVDALLASGVGAGQLHLCDLNTTPLMISCHDAVDVFSSTDEKFMERALGVCQILILAAVGKRGAPKFLKPHHLGFLPVSTFILQVAIDEGGNIDDPEFCRVTYWDDPVYRVYRSGKEYTVCDLPDIPGIIDPEESSRALAKANFEHRCAIFRAWPNVPSEYVVKKI